MLNNPIILAVLVYEKVLFFFCYLFIEFPYTQYTLHIQFKFTFKAIIGYFVVDSNIYYVCYVWLIDIL